VTPDDVSSFKQHGLWKAAADLREAFRSAKGRGSTDRETIARALAILGYLLAFRSSDARLFPSSRISDADTLYRLVDYINDQLEGWDQDAAMTQQTVSQIDSYCDAIIRDTQAWPRLQRDGRAEAIDGAAEAYRSAAEGSLIGVESTTAELEQALRAVTEEVELLRIQAKDLVSNATAARSDIGSSLESIEARAEDALVKRLETVTAAAKKLQDTIRQDAERQLADLHNKNDRADALLAHVADGTVAGGYDTFAAGEQRAYRFWNWVGGLTAAAGVIYLVIHFWDIDKIDTSFVIVRAALSLPVFGFSAYAFRVASHRHRQSVEARYRALDLIALPPYTEQMTDEQQSKLRMVLGERLFARSTEKEPVTDDTTPAMTSAQMQWVKDIVQLIQATR
jgi:hypothetical protein